MSAIGKFHAQEMNFSFASGAEVRIDWINGFHSDQVETFEDHVGCAIAVGRPEQVHHLPLRSHRDPLLRHRGARDVATSRSRSSRCCASQLTPACRENPISTQSGISIVSGWHRNASRVAVAFDGGERILVAYGTTRPDTKDPCGDDNNGFSLLSPPSFWSTSREKEPAPLCWWNALLP
jgi:hypothetical protein